MAYILIGDIHRLKSTQNSARVNDLVRSQENSMHKLIEINVSPEINKSFQILQDSSCQRKSLDQMKRSDYLFITFIQLLWASPWCISRSWIYIPRRTKELQHIVDRLI